MAVIGIPFTAYAPASPTADQAANAWLVLSQYLQLAATVDGTASALYALVGANVWAIDLPTDYAHSAAAVVVVIDSDMELGGSSASTVRVQLRCYGGSDDPEDAMDVARAVRLQLRKATNERVSAGKLCGASIQSSSGRLVRTPTNVRPFILLYANAVITP